MVVTIAPDARIVGLQWFGSTAVVSCCGVLDLMTAPHVDTAIRSVFVQEPSGLVLDLSAVRLLTCRGLTLLDQIDRETAGQLDFAVVEGKLTTKLLHFAGMHQRLAIYSTLTAAIWVLTGITYGLAQNAQTGN